MHASRRDLVKTFGAISLCGVIPGTILAATKQGTERRDQDDRWQQKLSRSLVENATAALAAAASAGRGATYTDLRLATFATRSLIDHLDEIGYTQAHEEQVLTYLESNAPVSDEAVAMLSRGMRARGVDLSPDDVRRMIDLSSERRSALSQRLRMDGLSGVLAISTADFDRAAGRMAMTQGQRRIHVEDDCGTLHKIADTMFVIAALDGIGCAFGCAPCCLIALAFGLGGAVLTLIADFIC